MTKQKIIAVIGAGECDTEIASLAEEVGKYIALRGYILVTGGLGGVMEAASKGAKSAGGITVGILPGTDRSSANQFIDIPLVTGMGVARNLVIIQSAIGVVAIGGKYGTLSEAGFALNLGSPVVGLKTWDIKGIIPCCMPKEAVDKVIELSKP